MKLKLRFCVLNEGVYVHKKLDKELLLKLLNVPKILIM